MQYRRDRDGFSIQFQRPRPEDFGFAGMAARFVINVAGLWLAQLLVRGFDIESAAALVFGALIFGIVNAVIKPVVSFIACPLTCLTLGFFLLIINAAMLALTGWIAGWFDMAFEVDGFWAAFLGGLVIAVTGTLLGIIVENAVLRPGRDERW